MDIDIELTNLKNSEIFCAVLFVKFICQLNYFQYVMSLTLLVLSIDKILAKNKHGTIIFQRDENYLKFWAKPGGTVIYLTVRSQKITVVTTFRGLNVFFFVTG